VHNAAMTLLIWLVIVLVIVIGGCSYARPARHAPRAPGSFAWWQRTRRRSNGWWH
jgi:amino acid transporter